jgi:adenylate cyclase class IV
MLINNAPFEVEFRCHFDSPEKAYEVLPFLRSCLHRKFTWTGTFYGLELFQSGQLLRIAEVIEGEDKQCYVTWKGPDTGKFANIRQEIVENITAGITDSRVLGLLGGKEHLQDKNEVIRELERLGYHQFMSWSGIDVTGFYELDAINVKLMSCEILKWPWLVEIEKMASTKEEAARCERELHELSLQFRLQEYLVKEEPPSLLYEKVFGHKSRPA